jgi:hypothetical protein
MVVCFVVGVPFFGSNYLLLMHAITIPFMMAHWALNDNTCVLSLIEKEVRKKMGQDIENKDCFTCQLINPIYDFKTTYEDWTVTIYFLTTMLWLTSVYKLYCGYSNGSIKSLQDLMVL